MLKVHMLILKRLVLESKIVYRIAINKKMALEDTDLHEADELALLPPFSGG